MILAMKPAFGSVVTGRDGSVLIAVGETVLQLGKDDYWRLMEMLSDAARRIAGADPQSVARARKTPPSQETHP